MTDEEWIRRCHKWSTKIANKCGTIASQQLKNVLLDMFESVEELLSDLEPDDWSETAIMDTLHREQSAFQDMDYCNTFYEIFKDIVSNNSENELDNNNNLIALPPSFTSPFDHVSRHTLDKLLLYGYCRIETEENDFNINILTDDDTIIYTLLLYYHIPIIFETINFNITEKDINKCKEIFKLQCPTLSHDSSQKVLWTALAISIKNRIPLLSLCIDSFARDRLNYYNKTQKLLMINEWS
eukprot:113570_1